MRNVFILTEQTHFSLHVLIKQIHLEVNNGCSIIFDQFNNYKIALSPENDLIHIIIKRSMKLVLKVGETVKLFSEEPTYSKLVQFLEKEFSLKKDAYALSFTDEEGDEIAIVSNSDVQIMKEVLKDKDYVKVQVTMQEKVPEEPKEGQPKEKIQETQDEFEGRGRRHGGKGGWHGKGWHHGKHGHHGHHGFPQPFPHPFGPFGGHPGMQEHERPQFWKGKPHWGRRHHQKDVSSKEKCQEKCQEKPEESNEKRERCQQRRKKWCQFKERRFEMIQKFINEKISKAVDERLQAMLPCFKAQLSGEQAPKLPENPVHDNFECKGCKTIPITGQRYECLTCSNFNLCYVCEQKIEHDHPLLKHKKAAQPKEENSDQQKWCDRMMFKKFFGRGRHHSSSSSSKEKWHGRKHEQFFLRKRCNKLAKVFGGNPEDYTEFAQKSIEMGNKEVFVAYAQEKKIPTQEFHAKIIQVKSSKLAEFFNKDPSNYTGFVKENIELNFRESIKLLKEKGIENYDGQTFESWKQRKRSWRKSCQKERRSCSKRRNCKKERSSKKEEKNVEEKKVQEPKISQQSEGQVVKKEDKSVTREKGSILKQMNEIFGEENSKEYFKFINEHYKSIEDKEKIIQLWIESHSH